MTYVVLNGNPLDSYKKIVSSEFFFSHDSGKLVYHVRTDENENAKVVMYNLQTRIKIEKKCFATTVVMNEAKNHLAAVVPVDGMQAVVDFSIIDPDKDHQSSTYELIKYISLSRDGKAVAFIAGKNGKIYLVVNGREYLLPDKLAIAGAPVLSDDGASACVVLESLNGRSPSSFTLYQTGQRYDENMRFGAIREQVYSSAGTLAYVAAVGNRYFTVINGVPGPEFDAAVSPLFTPDGRKLIYRARDGAKRMVVIANADGTGHLRFPSYEMVFPTGFTADGRSIGYGVLEGNKLIWKVDKL
jgi:hypothetical protein